MTDAGLVFVLMPFDDEFEAVYEQLIRAPLEGAGFTVRRADSLLNQQSILRDIVRGIVDAELIVADVTGLNSNVLYELGLAHALGKRTIMITRNIDELPFDLRPYKANAYSVLFSEAHKLKDLLVAVGEAVKANKAEFSNPVQDYAPEALLATAQVTTASAPASPPVKAPKLEPSADTSDRGNGTAGEGSESEGSESEPGFLERRLALDDAVEALTAHAGRIAELTDAVGEDFVHQGERLDVAKSRLGDRGAGAFLSISRDVARKLNSYSDAIAPEADALKGALEAFVENTDALARQSTIEDEQDLAAADETALSLQSLEESMAVGYEGITSMAGSLLTMPNMSRDLTKACKRAGTLLNQTGETILTAQAEITRTRGLIEERAAAYRRRPAADGGS